MGANISTLAKKKALVDSTFWKFCGRKDDVKKLQEVIQSPETKTLCVFGPKGIGKSRVILEVLQDVIEQERYEHNCYVDFSFCIQENTDLNNFNVFIRKLLKALGIEVKSDLTPCEKCKLCKKMCGCTIVLDKIAHEFIGLEQTFLVCFDNADNLINSTFQPHFLKFLKRVTVNGNHKLVITSGVRFHMTERASKLHSLHAMKNNDLRQLLNEILLDTNEEGERNISDPWIDAVVELCDGIPKITEVLGSILKEDDGLIEPIELVQLLISNYVKTLNPELFPATDKPAEEYSDVLEKFKEVSQAYQQTWLSTIADIMNGSTINPEEGLKAVRMQEKQVTSGMFKNDGLRKFLDHSLLQKDAGVEMTMKRLYKHLLWKAYHVLDANDDGLELKTYFGDKGIKLVKEEAKRVGLKLKEGETDPRTIELKIKQKDWQLRQEGSDSGRSSDDEDADEENNHHVPQGMENLRMFPNQYDRTDSFSGPHANIEHSFEPDSPNMTNNYDTSSTQGIHEKAAMPSQMNENNDSHFHTWDIKGSDQTTEEKYLLGKHEHTNITEQALSRTFPTTEWRKNKNSETSDMKPNIELTKSTGQICPSDFKRMSSEEYGQPVANSVVHTTEAKDAQQDSLTKDDGGRIHARYSASSTDSGETTLGLEMTLK